MQVAFVYSLFAFPHELLGRQQESDFTISSLQHKSIYEFKLFGRVYERAPLPAINCEINATDFLLMDLRLGARKKSRQTSERWAEFRSKEASAGKYSTLCLARNNQNNGFPKVSTEACTSCNLKNDASVGCAVLLISTTGTDKSNKMQPEMFRNYTYTVIDVTGEPSKITLNKKNLDESVILLALKWTVCNIVIDSLLCKQVLPCEVHTDESNQQSPNTALNSCPHFPQSHRPCFDALRLVTGRRSAVTAVGQGSRVLDSARGCNRLGGVAVARHRRDKGTRMIP